jgi:hypothetical protein
VFFTNKNRSVNYSVYGGYDRLGDAARRLLRSADSYKSNSVSLFYMSKALLDTYGAF